MKYKNENEETLNTIDTLFSFVSDFENEHTINAYGIKIAQAIEVI